jgi:hypothetical protein
LKTAWQAEREAIKAGKSDAELAQHRGESVQGADSRAADQAGGNALQDA